MWHHVDSIDLSKYHRKIKCGGRCFFLKFGKKNVKVFDWSSRRMHNVKRYEFSENKMDEHIMGLKLSEKSRKSLINIMTNKSSKNPKNALFGISYHNNDLKSYEKEIIKQLKNSRVARS